jgi:predicted nucleotidyltransferase
MDKNDALRLSQSYLKKLKNSNIGVAEAYLFGSFAKGNQHDNSDIDIAIVLKDHVDHTFDTDVQLMIYRKGEETMIEPHAFSKDEFDLKSPIVHQIITYGIKLEI